MPCVDRLTAWTPASRIERQGAANYQCVVLRHCIVQVCKSLLNGLHSASTELCSSFPLKVELADYQQPPPLEDTAQVKHEYLLSCVVIYSCVS